MRSVGSKISLKDLRNYNASEVKALETALPGVKGFKILTVPPPAGGVALIDILNILKGEFDSVKFQCLVHNNMHDTDELLTCVK